jgi:hypothetical protein
MTKTSTVCKWSQGHKEDIKLQQKTYYTVSQQLGMLSQKGLHDVAAVNPFRNIIIVPETSTTTAPAKGERFMDRLP